MGIMAIDNIIMSFCTLYHSVKFNISNKEKIKQYII